MKIELKGKDGKPIDLSKADPSITAALESVSEQVGSAVAAINEALKPLAGLPALTAKVEELAKAPATPPANPGNTGKPDPNAEVLASIKALAEQVQAVTGTVTADREAAAVRSRAEAYVQAKLPNLTGKRKDLVLAAIIAGKPKDEASIKTIVDSERERLKEFGGPEVDKAFAADPVKEGGQKGNPDQAKAEEATKLTQLNKMLESGRGTPVSK